MRERGERGEERDSIEFGYSCFVVYFFFFVVDCLIFCSVFF